LESEYKIMDSETNAEIKISDVDVDIYCGLGEDKFNKLRVLFRSYTPNKLSSIAKGNPSMLKQINLVCSRSTVLALELLDISWNTSKIPDDHVKLYALHDAMRRGEFTTLTIMVYRGYGKTAIKQNVSIVDIIFRRQRYILFVSELQGQAQNDLDGIKFEFRTNEMIKLLVGNVSYALDDDGGKVKKFNTYRTIFYLNNNPKLWIAVEIYGMNSSMRGLKVHGIRPTIVWLDDFESKRNSSSAAGREAIRDKIRMQLLPMGQAKDFLMVFQGTIVHKKAWLAETKKDFNNNIIGAFCHKGARFFERPLSTDHINYGVGTLPEFHDRAFFDKSRQPYLRKGEYWKFLQEFYNIIPDKAVISLNSEMLNEVAFQYHSLDNGKIQWLEDENGHKISCKTYIGIDPAYSFASRADDTVMLTLAITPNGDAVIIDLYVDKIDMTDKLNKMFELANRFHPDNICIEAFGAALELPHSFEREMWEKKQRWNYTVFKERIGKSAKYLTGLSPMIDSGKLSYIKGCKNIELLKFQMDSFNGEERYHDDTIDGLFLAYNDSLIPNEYNVEERIERLKKRNRINNTSNPYDIAMNELAVRNKNKNNLRGWRL